MERNEMIEILMGKVNAGREEDTHKIRYRYLA